MDSTVELFNMIQQWFLVLQKHLNAMEVDAAARDAKIDQILALVQTQRLIQVTNTNTSGSNASNVGERAEVGQIASGQNKQELTGG